MTRAFPTVSPVSAGLRCRCPRCGVGPLFDGLLTVTDTCSACGLDLKAEDSGDGPAVFVIFIIAPIVVGLAFWLEVVATPPYWLHLVLWPPLVILSSIFLLRPLKALLIALQFRHKAGDTGQNTFDPEA